MRRILLFLCFVGSLTTLSAQLPKSNVYLFDIRQVSDTNFQFSLPRYLTNFNANGYNNQPAFFSNNELCISTQMPQQAQPELYLLNLKNKTRLRVTSTIEGEYSPARTPDYYSFSAIRQEYSGRDTFIRLWQFPSDRLTNGRPVFKYLNNIGYYEWLNSNQVAVFLVDNPSYLALADVNSDKVVPLATNVGRCFRKLPNGNLAYVQKNEFGGWNIMERNLFRPQAEPRQIINTLTDSEDFVVLPNGTFLMGKGSKLYKINPRSDTDWKEIVDLRFYNIRNISRLAISTDMQLAVVAD